MTPNTRSTHIAWRTLWYAERSHRAKEPCHSEECTVVGYILICLHAYRGGCIRTSKHRGCIKYSALEAFQNHRDTVLPPLNPHVPISSRRSPPPSDHVPRPRILSYLPLHLPHTGWCICGAHYMAMVLLCQPTFWRHICFVYFFVFPVSEDRSS